MSVTPNAFGGWDILGEELNGSRTPVKYKLAEPAADLTTALAAAEQFIYEHRASQVVNLRKDQPWRRGPMSQKARVYMNSLVEQAGLHLDTSTINAGTGADIIHYCKELRKGRIVDHQYNFDTGRYEHPAV